ncbi:MAG TPA: hypothetical protein VH416_03595 [Gaiellaceae bacterium]|jgi:hypothetical protein
MAVARLAAVLLAVIALGSAGAAARTSSTGAPTGLHGFLLRADEPVRDSFSRTPAFAWKPVAGAVGYDFQLSTSSTFRDSGLLYPDAKEAKIKITTPVVAPRLTLPWITGSPHALYARVRASFADGSVSGWSTPFGFDMTPPAAPKPLPSVAGVLRWTPVAGADVYEVWLVDAKKTEFVYTNVLDEREFYSFHQSQSWTGSVRWRVRAARKIMDKPANGVPAAGYGPWSPTYVSTNTSYTTGQINLEGTISDVVSNGSSTAKAHRLMPAFYWTGNQTEDGTPAELFRVYVFTDKTCLNPVFTSAVVGSQAYSPRPYGPLALPVSATSLATARTSYLGDMHDEPTGLTYDGDTVTTSESGEPASPTVALQTQDGSQAPASIEWDTDSNFGAPVDLWDTNWPDGGYYWTVIPVAAVSPGAVSTSIAAPGAPADSTSLPVVDSTHFNGGDVVDVGFPGSKNFEGGLTVTATTGNQLTFASALKFSHGAGEPISRTGGNLIYQDLELAPDVCAAGRVARFGKDSEPSLTSSGDLFASGLSSSGRLTSARHTSSFYGSPLVSWTPALGAMVYAVQWSKTRYPFVPQADPSTQGLGILTATTSAVLPLAPGTWYYRVRGYDYSLPSGEAGDPINSQAMSWSDPVKIVVARPRFAVVTAKPKKHR